jgi:phosphohistidine phosphatase
MKRLYIVRHASAQEKGGPLPDFERSLIKKGEKEARASARHLALKYPAPDLMISSFANRAIETAHIFAETFGYPPRKILLRDSFYGDLSPDALLKVITAKPDKYQSLMLFGHDPAFSELAAKLIEGFSESIPKSGVVIADLPIESWAETGRSPGRLVEFTHPARIKDDRKKARGELDARLVRSMMGVLSRIDKTAAQSVGEDIRDCTRKIVKSFLKARKAADRPET